MVKKSKLQTEAGNSDTALCEENENNLTSNNLVDRILQIQEKNTSKNISVNKQKSNKSNKTQDTRQTENQSIDTTEKPLSRQKNRGRAGTTLIEEAQLDLFEQELKGRFVKKGVKAESEYPTFLTRLPLFRPAKRSNQRDCLDQENAMPFVTPWGVGKKHGPPLTVYDEDTLIALGRLRQSCLIGNPHRLPLPVSDHYRTENKSDVNVHVAQFMLSDVQRMCGTELSGQTNRMRLDSIKRLAATVIEFDNKTADKYIATGTSVKLVDVAWQYYEDNGLLYVQFTPVMARWFEDEYTYIDWKVRQKLSDTGKAVHRFLSGQPKTYQIFTKKLMITIGYVRTHARFIGDLRKAMGQLEEAGWIHSWEIVGTGRSTPRKLMYSRISGNTKINKIGVDDQIESKSDETKQS